MSTFYFIFDRTTNLAQYFSYNRFNRGCVFWKSCQTFFPPLPRQPTQASETLSATLFLSAFGDRPFPAP
jgi:hypothetical protein